MSVFQISSAGSTLQPVPGTGAASAAVGIAPTANARHVASVASLLMSKGYLHPRPRRLTPPSYEIRPTVAVPSRSCHRRRRGPAGELLAGIRRTRAGESLRFCDEGRDEPVLGYLAPDLPLHDQEAL